MTFDALGLAPELLRAVRNAGYETPTPIQMQAIPVALAGRDVLGAAQTGTGKTAGFTLPLLQRLKGGRRGVTRALILAPTRELAAQVEESVRTYGKFTSLRSTAIFGGVGMEPQIRTLRRGVEILVATPGRLLDHMGRGNVDLSHVEILVLDEADRMLDMGFLPDVRRIVRAVPDRRQTLFFSATMPPAIQELAREILKDPAFIEVGRQSTPTEGVRQVLHPVEHDQKRRMLLHLLQEHELDQVLVFTRTKHGANRLEEQLKRAGWRVAALHSNKSQTARIKALKAFRDGIVQILVATDIAARGIDVEGISHVINFDMPHGAEDYVHRVGRTARASATGDAISLVEPEDWGVVREIAKLTGQEIAWEIVPGFEPPYLVPPPLAQSARHPRPRGSRPGARPYGDRPRSDRSYGERSRGERPYRGGRPRPARSSR